jgi:hypothetical protein
MVTLESLNAELNNEAIELVVAGAIYKDASTGSWSISGPGPSWSDYQ